MVEGSFQGVPTALRFARLVFCVEPPQQIPRSSKSAVALSADVYRITLLYQIEGFV